MKRIAAVAAILALTATSPLQAAMVPMPLPQVAGGETKILVGGRGHHRGHNRGHHGHYRSGGGHAKFGGDHVVAGLIGLGIGLLLAPLAHGLGHDHRHYGHGHPGYPRRGHRTGLGPHSDCHPVEKDAYDSYGRFARFGATMCYDAHGTAYILAGSRRVLWYH